jgi:glycosyltransferase involved in cell wall biosynthesis
MNLCLVISSLSCGGAERVMSILANQWAEDGNRITLLTLSDGSTPPFFELSNQVNWVPLNLLKESKNGIHGVLNNINRIRTLRNQFKKLKPDVIISFIDQVNILTVWSAKFLNIPVVISERTDPEFITISPVWRKIRNFSYNFCDTLVVQTQQALAYYRQRIRPHIEIIHNPLSREFIHQPITNQQEREKILLAVGRLEYEKGYDNLLKAFSQIHKNNPEWKLVITGEGSLRNELETMCDQLELAECVDFPGRTLKQMNLYLRASIFVMSSRVEGFPNALCEAMASGCAVVSFDAPSGPREIISNHENGLLIPLDDVNALASAIDTLINDESMRSQLATKGIKSMQRLYPEVIMKQWNHLVQNIRAS